MPLSPSFFKRPTLQVAQNLLGTYLLHESKEGRSIGKIVETEAYLADDPACHAFGGPTPRNQPMFGPPGRAYVYFIYGMYHCFNVVTHQQGVGEAVLIRALEPIEGIELMQKRRKKKTAQPFKIHELCNGPAKLVIAMGILKSHNHHPLLKAPLWLAKSTKKIPSQNIGKGSRIGIQKAADLHYRFYLIDNHFVSRKNK